MKNTGIDWEKQYRNLEDQLETMLLSIAKRMDSLEKGGNKTARIHKVESGYKKGVITCINVAFVEDPEFAWYIYLPSGTVEKVAYSRGNVLTYRPKEKGTYRISGYVRSANKTETVLVKTTGKIVVSTSGGE